MRTAFGFLLLLLGHSLLAADTPTAQVAARLRPVDTLRGSFVEEKQLAGFSKPLTSRGHFVLNRERGVLWRIEQPLDVEYRFGKERIALRENGSKSWRSSEAPRGLQRFGPLFLSVLRGDTAALEKDFALRAEVNGGHWTLTAEPQHGMLQRAFLALRISGAERVERIAIEEKSGDRSVITLVAEDGAEAALSPQEAEDFAP